jgi:hypothetical protein
VRAAGQCDVDARAARRGSAGHLSGRGVIANDEVAAVDDVARIAAWWLAMPP